MTVLSHAQPLRSSPTTVDLFSTRVLPEPLVPHGSEPTAEVNQALALSLDAFQNRAQSDDFSALEHYLSANPESPWRLAVQTNLGLLQYNAGYFSRCIPTYLAAWEAGKAANETKAKALADRAAGEYVKMLARLGRLDTLKAFLAEVKDRPFVGQATELIRAGIEGSSMMELHPELAYRCGPLALSRILAEQKSPLATSPHLVNSQSTAQGICLADVAALSAKVSLNYQAAKRSPGACIILPSVIHWKVGHYAALTQHVGERYLTEDPTFENKTWHSTQALEAEASGYFLVPSGPLPEGWASVTPEEAKTIFGKGTTSGLNPQMKPGDLTTSSGSSGSSGLPDEPPTGCPMASYSFRIMLASLQISDSPVGYRPPYGYPTFFTVTYVQRDPSQPSNFNYSNLGPKWSFNWQRYIIAADTPAVASQATSGGAVIDHTYSDTSGGYYNYSPQFDTYKTMRRAIASESYEVTNPNGSKEIYAQPDGSTAYPRKVFLTQMIDPAGNATTLSYDGQLRLTTITDALGQQTHLAYAIAGDPYKISSVTDPFGRTATFSYDASGRLTTIQDVIGIQSGFTYSGSTDFINSLTTPYGTTSFTNTETGSIRRLTATDPAGDTEVLESNYLTTAAVPFGDALAPTIQGAAFQYDQYHSLRNSFHWNKKQWKEAPNDYNSAHIYHWLHDRNFTQTSPYLESEKAPLSSRIYHVYPEQGLGLAVGTSISPSAIGRTVEGDSQVTQFTYNKLGKMTSQTDPLGRRTNYAYSAVGIDLISVSQGVDSTYLARNLGGSAVGTFGPDLPTPTSGAYSYSNPIDSSGLTSPAPESVYQTGRVGTDFSYAFDGYGASAHCTVRLHFAETYYDTAGSRIFKVKLNGTEVLNGFDIFAAAGNVMNKAVIREFPITTDATGRITIQFIATKDSAIVSGIEILNPASRVPQTLATYTYNANHLPLTVTDAAGQTTTYTYNGNGQITSITNAKSETTTLSYYSADVSGKQRKGRLAAIDGPLSGTADTTTLDYSATGTIASVTGPDGYTLTFTHDAIDRLTRTTYPDGTYTETTYQALDPQTSRDRLGRLTTYVYNSLRQLASVTDPANRTIQYKWCKCGDMAQLIDAMGRITRWKHDIAGRIANKEYTDGSKILYAYQPLSGRLSSITDEKGQVKTRAYNLDDTLAGITYTNVEHATPNVSYTYDSDYRRLTSMVDGIGTTVYAYHPISASPALGAGRLASVDGPWANDTITYGYDQLGRVISRAIDGAAETTTFDAAGRVNTITNVLGTFTYTYDGATSRLARAVHEDGVAREFTYLPNLQDRRLQRIRNLKPDGTPLSVFDYTYDAHGRITTWRQQQDADAANAQTWTLGYDAADQLTSNVITQAGSTLSTSSWTYDPAANRTSETVNGVTTTFGYNALNELVNTSATLPATTYEWDAENRLVAVTEGENRSEYINDGQSRRVRIVDKVNGVQIDDKTYLWNELMICECRDSSGGLVRARYFNQGLQSALATPNQIQLNTQDHLGSVRDVVNTTGDLNDRIYYDAWGIAFPKLSGSFFSYTGHIQHRNSDLILAPYRVYNSAIGRWLSRDPIGEIDQINLFVYVNNDPISNRDETGLFAAQAVAYAIMGFVVLHGELSLFLDNINPPPLFPESPYPPIPPSSPPPTICTPKNPNGLPSPPNLTQGPLNNTDFVPGWTKEPIGSEGLPDGPRVPQSRNQLPRNKNDVNNRILPQRVIR